MDNAKGRYWDKPLSLVEKFNGHVVTRPESLNVPLRTRKPTVWAIWNDLFHETVDDEFIRRAFLLMAHGDVQQHTFLVLTKRPERMVQAMNGIWSDTENIITYHMPQVWAGVTVCNQAEADEKIHELLKVPGKKWLSIEPMLGPIDVSCIKVGAEHSLYRANTLTGDGFDGHNIDAAVLGGETGPGARPMHPDWVRSVRDQCAASNVPFYFKQWGEYCAGCQLPDDVNSVKDGILMDFFGDVLAEDGSSLCSPDSITRLFRVGKKRAGRLLDGRTHDELPWG